jgi:hypothetical protein
MHKNLFKKILIFLIFICFFQADANQQASQKKAKKDQHQSVAIDQGRLIEKISAYLAINHRDTKVLEDKDGVCNGLSFLAQYYGSKGKQEQFFQALESIATWDGKKQSLQKPSGIPSSIGNSSMKE